MTDDAVLRIANLTLKARVGDTFSTLVEEVSLHASPGECVGIVGESGCGKSLTLRAAANVLPRSISRSTGTVDVIGHTAMVFQEPMTTLNPTMRVGTFIAEGPRARGVRRKEALQRAIQLLSDVGVPDAAVRAQAWPHELSGGLRQRAMIAAALATDPTVLLCDEPTTALDATVQAQLIGLLDRLRRERNMAMVFVSHNIAVVAQLAQRLIVMYAGRIVEEGPTERLLNDPRHPYTAALLRSVPTRGIRAGGLTTIPGAPPDPTDRPTGCSFAPRCSRSDETCTRTVPTPELVEQGHTVSCHHPDLSTVQGLWIARVPDGMDT